MPRTPCNKKGATVTGALRRELYLLGILVVVLSFSPLGPRLVGKQISAGANLTTWVEGQVVTRTHLPSISLTDDYSRKLPLAEGKRPTISIDLGRSRSILAVRVVDPVPDGNEQNQGLSLTLRDKNRRRVAAVRVRPAHSWRTWEERFWAPQARYIEVSHPGSMNLALQAIEVFGW